MLVLQAFEQQRYEWVYAYVKPYADSGDSDAACMIGVLFQLGTGVAQDPSRAEEWFKKAAEWGSVIAWNNLGTLYASGALGVADHDRAKLCYKKAKELGGPTNEGYASS
jgi:TPR repeat protein